MNIGEVVATRETTGADFLVTGDAVNVAARLQQNAEPGTIVAGERTRRAARGFRFGEPKKLVAKGKKEPIVASVVLEGLADQRAPGAPFLGRDHDLAQLRLAATEPSVVSLEANPANG